jgi:hypothetical protein
MYFFFEKIKTVANGLTTFEITSAGVARMQALKLLSGGVDILSGGLRVGRGFLSIHANCELKADTCG